MNSLNLTIPSNGIIKETPHFRLYYAGWRFRVRCKDKRSVPRGRVISCRDANYLAQLSTQPDANRHSTFDSACCIELGVGVFRA